MMSVLDVRASWRTFSTSLGQRGKALLIFSCIFFAIGVKTILVPSPDTGNFMIYAMLPTVLRVLLWFVPAVLGVIAAFHKTRTDGIGFGALSVPATIVLVSHCIAALVWLTGLSDHLGGWSAFGGRMVNVCEWALILALLLLCASWPNVFTKVNPDEKHIREQTVLVIKETPDGGDL